MIYSVYRYCKYGYFLAGLQGPAQSVSLGRAGPSYVTKPCTAYLPQRNVSIYYTDGLEGSGETSIEEKKKHRLVLMKMKHIRDPKELQGKVPKTT